jgi:Family of unknown function (DUF6603)
MMADSRGTLERLIGAVGLALLPLQDLLSTDNLPTLTFELGLDQPLPDLSADSAFTQKLAAAAANAAAIAPDIINLIEAAEADDTAGIIKNGALLVDAVAELVTALDTVATDLTRATAGSPGAGDIAAFAEQFVERLLEDAVIRYIESTSPTLAQTLALLAFIEFTPVDVTVAGTSAQIFRRRMHLDRIGQLLTDSLGYLDGAYGWGSESFDLKTLLQRIGWLFDALGPLAGFEDTEDGDPAFLELFAVILLPTSTDHPPGIQARLAVDVTEAVQVVLSRFGDNWRLALELKGSFLSDLTAKLLPPAQLEVTHPTATVEGDVGLALIGEAPASDGPFLLFGEAAGSRMQARSLRLALAAGMVYDAGAGKAQAALGLDGACTGGHLVIDTSHADGFLARLLPSDGVTLDFDFAIGWSAQRGFYFSGSAALELAFALGLTIGPVTVDVIHLVIGVADAGLRTEISVDATGAIGPVSAAVERIGVTADLAFSRGNLGPVDLGIGFKFPAGLGVAIDAGPVTGGGFIEFDPDNGRYAGVLALSLYSVQVKAIGLLDTRLPGGQEGYSFLVIISVEFTPIQLGFGFTLNGVGGLCGINRNFVTDAIQAGLRQHSLDHILFPKDPVKNAPAIISDLRTIFPPAEGRYVFGPMLEIGWGGGLNLVTAELGILLAVPAPVVIAILGQLNVALPDPDAAIVELHLDVLGIIDFGKKLFSLDATLHDSHIAAFTIYGDMAMRLNWGGNPSFALSIGGLNPHFQPPPGFPTLKRLTIALAATDNFRLSIQTYFAITSNTFQLGAHAELYVGVSAFNVYGWLGFDALIIFEPFSFVVDFTAGLALRSGTDTLLGITIDGELSGPTPWHAKGEAHVTLLFFDIGVHVDITWGESQQVAAPQADVWPQLRDAIANVANWSGALARGVPAVASLAKPTVDTASTVLVDPSGALTMRERVCPLDQTLTRFGTAVPGPQNLFHLNTVSLGGHSVPFTIMRDKFAPAQFEQMSDQEKLSRPSFEDRDAGLSVGDGLVSFGQGFGLDLAYEDVYVDDEAPPPPTPVKFIPGLDRQILWAQLGSAARSGLRTVAMGGYAPAPTDPPLVTLAEESFVVASISDLSARTDISAPTTKGEAYLALAGYLRTNPAEDGALQVVPIHELAP